MRKFSVKPAITIKGRKFKGIRGWAGKPTHPPLTDIPIGAFVLAAGLDVLSAIGGKGHTWTREMWHAGTFMFVAGIVVAFAAMLTGYVDWKDSSEPGTQARRTINTHATIMITATTLAIVNLVLRLNSYHTAVATPPALAVLTVIVAGLVSWGATYGGSLVFDYGFNVETAGDHPVWSKSEEDVFPGSH